MSNFAKLVAQVVQQANGSEDMVKQGLLAGASSGAWGMTSAETLTLTTLISERFDLNRFLSASAMEESEEGLGTWQLWII